MIVLTAFGTSVPAAQKALESIDARMRAAFPAEEFTWAFTSSRVTEKLRARGQHTLFAREVPLRTLPEVYADLRESGQTEAVVQSLHVSPGSEYEKVLQTPAPGLQVRYGPPLLAEEANVSRFAEALAPRFGGPDTVTILCGHGNDRHEEYNRRLVGLDQYVRDRYGAVYVATVEGHPGTERAFADAAASGRTRVKFVPVMIVAGDHMMNDVMGDDGESWKSTLGLPATAEGGLGENDAIVDLFVEQLREVLAQSNADPQGAG